MSKTRFNELLPSKAVHCFIPLCLLIWCREGFKGRGNSHKSQLQPRELNLLYAEGGRAALQSHWCSLCIGGQAGHKLQFAAAHLQELYRQENKLSSLSDTCHTAWSVSKGTTFLYPITACCGPSIKMNQAQQPTLAWHKHRPASPTWHRLSRGKDTLRCVNMAVLLLQTALHLKARSFAEGTQWYQAKNPVQNLMLHMPESSTEAVGERTTMVLAPPLWSRPRCQAGLQYHTREQSQWQLRVWAEDCKTTATTSASTLHSPVLLSEGCVSSESSRAAFESCPSCKHWGAQGEYPQLP